MEAARRAGERQAAPLALGTRYLLLTAAATAIAAAATWQRVLEMTPAQRRQLVETVFASADGDGEAGEGSSAGFRVDGRAPAAFDEAAAPVMFAIRVFFAELSSSRLGAMIAVHFLLVMVYHVFLALGRVCFGEIRLQELQQTKETMIHFVLMRCLLLASTMGPSLDGRSTLGPLFVWLSFLTLLRGLLTLCKARFHHLLTRPMTSVRDLRGLSSVLGLILVLNLGLAFVCSHFGLFVDKISNVPWFEASLLLIKTMQLGAKVGFHMLDIGNTSVSLSDDEDTSSSEGYSENGEFYLLLFQTALSGLYLVVLVLYYLYIISVDQFRVSLFDLILIINVKNATVLLLEKVKQVKFYHKLVVDMDELFTDATQEELDAVADDVCVICLKPMPTQAKKLHCGHLFHRFCLRQCLQKASIGDSLTGLDTLTRMANGMALDPPTTSPPNAMSATTLRCPLCRKHVYSGKDSLSTTTNPPGDEDATPRPPAATRDEPVESAQGGGGIVQEPQQQPEAQAGERVLRDQAEGQVSREEVLRFSTEFLSRWIPFPNFSFEIVRNPHGGNGAANRFNATPEMIQQIWEVFPQYSFDEIRADLQRTRSPELTMNRILNGRLDQQRQQLEGEAGGIQGEPLGGLAEAIDDLEHDLRWSLSTLWSSMWAPRPHPAQNAEAAVLSPRNNTRARNGSGEDWQQ